LGQVRHANGSRRLLVDATGRVGGVVAADRHQPADVEAAQVVEYVAHFTFRLGRVGARRAEDRAAAAVDRLDRVDGQLAELGPSGLHQGFETVEKAAQLGAVVDRLDRYRADDALDTGRPAA